MGLNLTKQTKLDFVDFLWITLTLHWSAQMGWDKNHGVKNLLYMIYLSKIYVTMILTME